MMEWLSLLTDNLGVAMITAAFVALAIFTFKDTRKDFENIEDLNDWQDGGDK